LSGVVAGSICAGSHYSEDRCACPTGVGLRLEKRHVLARYQSPKRVATSTFQGPQPPFCTSTLTSPHLALICPDSSSHACTQAVACSRSFFLFTEAAPHKAGHDGTEPDGHDIADSVRLLVSCGVSNFYLSHTLYLGIYHMMTTGKRLDRRKL